MMPNAPQDATQFSKLDRMQAYLIQQDYVSLGEYCEQVIEQEPEEVSNYWYLGLALLLQGNEADAQMAWMTPLLEAEPEQVEQWTADLTQILDSEARNQAAQENYETAWLLRQHLREFIPEDLANLLLVLELGLKANTFSLEDELLGVIVQRLRQTAPSQLAIESEHFLQIIASLIGLGAEHPAVLDFLHACIPHIEQAEQTQPLVEILLAQGMKDFQVSRGRSAINLGKIAVQLTPDYLKALSYAIFFMQSGDAQSLLESIPLTKQRLAISDNITDQISATHDILTSLMLTCQNWQESLHYYQLHKTFLASLLPSLAASQNTKHQQDEQVNKSHELLAMGMFCFYFEDDPTTNRPIRNQVAQIAQAKWRSDLPDYVERYQHHSGNYTTATKPLKIGYLSSCLRLHSVGWLVRWLLAHHDRHQFEIHLYSTRQSNDPLQQAFINAYGENFHHLPNVATEIADQIDRDQIDILVELDSITAFDTCVVSALKPAPVQVTWLGCDASGIPAIDYYIADPYVLPNNAQEYYSETIWRLPQTYIAVDGFEVGVPDLRRDYLNIPSDAIVYLSSQTGLKRNPHNVRLQLQILKQVPNSYFLIKSFNAEPELLKAFFYQLAEEEGVSGDRLRFLPDFPDNAVYRANLGLADVVLDTYPYNGATTTLEALWVGLPIVTRVGEQFAARNSYTMMMNVGVTEGLAWSDQEYVEWGVRLGEDAALRRNISYRLRRSRQGAPLWNGQQFAREIEKAYKQMWEQKL